MTAKLTGFDHHAFERMNMEDYDLFQMSFNDITEKTDVVFDAKRAGL